MPTFLTQGWKNHIPLKSIEIIENNPMHEEPP